MIKDKDIVEQTGISRQSISNYKRERKELYEILKIGTYAKMNNININKIKRVIALEEAFTQK